ncbi:MAG: succinate dehydrogenase, partial [Saprospiraceae bacterium]
MAEIILPVADHRFGKTNRKDAWYVQPALVFTILSSFVIYATWAAFQGRNYAFGSYISPLYSPELFGDSAHSWFGPKPNWYPTALPWSPALLILWAPGLFRLTCYYYRGAYYKAFWASPSSCAVSEPRKKYRGENSFPLIIQNVHRYLMYIALIFILFLSYDVWKALWFTEVTTGETHFGIGLGTLVLTANVILLGGYTLGCHSLRHAVGGIMDRLSGAPVRRTAYMCVT